MPDATPTPQLSRLAGAVPPHAYFLVSAVFHYLGPAFARVEVLGVAWLRIASAALIFALWRRPWRTFAQAGWRGRRLMIAQGVILGVMNSAFYLAIDQLPLGTVGAIEYVFSIVLAAFGLRSWRNWGALGLAIAGVALLTQVRLGGEPLGFALAFVNGLLFMLYVVLGHRLARDGGGAGIDRLAVAMLVAFWVVLPLGLREAWPALTSPTLLLTGVGIGVCSSVIPYICDQLAMARLPRATFALLLSLLPASAAVIGAVVLGQIPTLVEMVGIGLVVLAVAVHQERASR